MGLIEAGLYGGFSLLNYYISRKYFKNMSTTEKVGIGTATAMGIDSIITPAIKGGRSLHEILGLAPLGPVGDGIKLGEQIFAYGGQFYHWIRNMMLARKAKKELK